VGFIHGVMNTDNVAVSGQTIDYGPCAFLDTYDPAKVFSSIDASGRYAFGNQARVATWNLARLAEALLPLIHAVQETAIAEAEAVLRGFAPQFEADHLQHMRAKLGLSTALPEDGALIAGLLETMAAGQADFTLTFRALSRPAGPDGAPPADLAALFADPKLLAVWYARYQDRLRRDPASPEARERAMQGVNPRVIPRNHRIEAVIRAALAGDLSPFHELVTVLSTPYADTPDAGKPGQDIYAAPPAAGEHVLQTFCGT
ncbi:MAG: hypothetical protein B7Z15_11485, partial [Rhizobiales bacterium 32-66-8]